MPITPLLITIGLILNSISPLINAQSSGRLNWQITHLPDAPSLRALSVAHESIWVAGTHSKIFKSDDLGVSWNDISLSDGFIGDIRDIQVFSKHSAIVMTVGEGKKSRLYSTTDSGKNWQLLFINPDKKGFFDSIDFWDNQRGLLLGDPVDGYYTVLKTLDGGKSWQRIKQDALPTKLKNEAAFAASGNTLITNDQHDAWITTGGFSASVYHSSDNGDSWRRMPVPLHQINQTSGGYGLAFNSDNRIFVVGGDYLNRHGQYNNLASYQPGQNPPQWRPIKSGNRGLRTALHCQQKICIMTGKTGSDISFNNGMSWQPFSQHGFYTLSGDQSLFVAAGADGKVGIIRLKKHNN